MFTLQFDILASLFISLNVPTNPKRAFGIQMDQEFSKEKKACLGMG